MTDYFYYKEFLMEPKTKHLTISERYEIEKMLGHGRTFNEIPLVIDRAKSTVSHEVKNNRKTLPPRVVGKVSCANSYDCTVRKICGDGKCMMPCSSCQRHSCYDICPNFEVMRCKKLNFAPYVCNACKQRDYCGLQQSYYTANSAQRAYEKTLRESRQGANKSADEIKKIDELISPLIKKGQSICHIFANHEDEISCSEKTLYNYVDSGILSVKNIDLPRKVRYKRRKKKRAPQKDYKYRIGRTYKDFLDFQKANPDLNYVQMDTVKGSRDKGKCFLTMQFVKFDLLLIFILDSCTQKAVTEVFDRLSNLLGSRYFRRYFPVILTDNGSKFKHPHILKVFPYGGKQTQIFYCEPMSSWQKGSLENAHALIRRVRPKGASLDDLTQDDCNLLMNHINSYHRDDLDGKTPFAVAFSKSNISKAFADKLELKLINPDDVLLKPQLLKK